MNDIEEIRNKCKSKNPRHSITLHDIRAVYFLYDDPTVSRRKLAKELRRTSTTLQHIDEYIKQYIKDNDINVCQVTDIEFYLQEILQKYLKGV